MNNDEFLAENSLANSCNQSFIEYKPEEERMQKLQNREKLPKNYEKNKDMYEEAIDNYIQLREKDDTLRDVDSQALGLSVRIRKDDKNPKEVQNIAAQPQNKILEWKDKRVLIDKAILRNRMRYVRN